MKLPRARNMSCFAGALTYTCGCTPRAHACTRGRSSRARETVLKSELKQPLVKPWEDVVKARDEVLDSMLSDEMDHEHHHANEHGVIDVRPINEAVPQAAPEETSHVVKNATAKAESTDTPATSEHGRSDG